MRIPSTKTSSPRGFVAVLAAFLVVACGGEPPADPSPEPFPAPRQVFLITIDTLRADHLGCMGYPRDVSPTIDRLAAEGVLFTQAYASSSTTVACHASLFTSLEPPQHRMVRNGVEMHPSLFTMAEMFRAQRYATAGFSTVNFMKAVARGFDVFKTQPKFRPADRVVREAIRWLDGKKPTDRLFVWVHLFDVHEWYQLHNVDAEQLEVARGLPPTGTELARYLQQEQGLMPSTFTGEEMMVEAVHRYDGQILAVDAAIKKLYGFARAEGLGEDALWILTADHGEGLGSHGFHGHGGWIYNEQIRVPLIFHFTSGRYAGRVVDGLSRHVDLLPTLAEMLGTTVDRQAAPIVGRSLLELLEDRSGRPIRYAFAQRREADELRLSKGWEEGTVFSIQSLDYKYIYRTHGADELFDLRSDPLESVNLAGGGSAIEDRMRADAVRLQGILYEQGADLGRGEINPEYIEELKALGYL